MPSGSGLSSFTSCAVQRVGEKEGQSTELSCKKTHLTRRRFHDAVCAANGLFELLIGASLTISAESQLRPLLQHVLRLPLLLTARPLRAGGLLEAALDRPVRLSRLLFRSQLLHLARLDRPARPLEVQLRGQPAVELDRVLVCAAAPGHGARDSAEPKAVGAKHADARAGGYRLALFPKLCRLADTG